MTKSIIEEIKSDTVEKKPDIEGIMNQLEKAEVIPAMVVKSTTKGDDLKNLVGHEYGYAKLGLFLGVICILGGIFLCINGVAGATNWTAKIIGLESKINDATPGVVLFIVGIFIVQITKPQFKHI